MLKFLYPEIEWQNIKAVGFDLDGTLYDDMDFITQVYAPISRFLADVCKGNHQDIYRQMMIRWLEKGSSYNRIFDEILTGYEIDNSKKESIIVRCIEIYSSYKPDLTLNKRVMFLLDFFYNNYDLFMITDGNASLQSAKIKSLQIERWIKRENIGITGILGKDYYKPSTMILKKISIFANEIQPNEVVYFGDRKMDYDFARNAGFHFVYVKCMQRGSSNGGT